MLDQQQQRELITKAGLRITAQRLALVKLLFADETPRHVTAEDIYTQANKNDASMSLATVYNTLHRFTEVGLLHEVLVEPERVWFDTNMHNHHHIYDEDTGILTDIPAIPLSEMAVPYLETGKQIEQIDLMIRVRSQPTPLNP